MIAILALGGSSLVIIFSEINQAEDSFLGHVQEPCHGVACVNMENVQEDLKEIKSDIKELDKKITVWYLEREP